jgi:hypothetical protein
MLHADILAVVLITQQPSPYHKSMTSPTLAMEDTITT